MKSLSEIVSKAMILMSDILRTTGLRDAIL